MPRRFHADPMVRAADLLLQERIPADSPIVEAAPYEPGRERSGRPAGVSLLSRRLTTPATAAPRTHLLSNTQYHVMVTNAGSGYSRCQGLDVTRWREDPTCEGLGQFFYIRDLHSGDCLVGRAPAGRASGRRVRGGLLHRQGPVPPPRRGHRDLARDHRLSRAARRGPPDHPDEPRQQRPRAGADQLRGARARSSMAPTWPTRPSASCSSRPSESPTSDSLLCRRRPRSADEHPPWAVHVMAVDRSTPGCTVVGDLQYETDRARFLGRGRTLADPAALGPGARLSGTTGPVLDPVFSLRRSFRIAPGGSAVVGFTLALADSRDAALALADKYHGISAVARAFELAWAHSQVEHGHRNWSPEDAHLYQRLGSHLLFAGSALRAHSAVLAANRLAQPALWRWGISGDRPIVLARIAEEDELALARQLLVAHAFLRLKGLESDLVLLNEERAERRRRPRRAALTTRQPGRGRRPGRPARRGLPDPQRGTLGGRFDPARGGGSCRPRRRPGAPLRPARSNRMGPNPAGRPGRIPAAGPLGRRAGRFALRPAVLQRTGRLHRRWPRILRARPVSGATVRPAQRPAGARRSAPAAPAPRPLGERRGQSRASDSSSPRRARASPGRGTARPTA